jgi:hypothetical protein
MGTGHWRPICKLLYDRSSVVSGYAIMQFPTTSNLQYCSSGLDFHFLGWNPVEKSKYVTHCVSYFQYTFK